MNINKLSGNIIVLSQNFIDKNFINVPNKYKVRNTIVLFMFYFKFYAIMTYIFNMLNLLPFILTTFSCTSFTIGYLLCLYYPIDHSELINYYDSINEDLNKKGILFYDRLLLASKHKYKELCLKALKKFNFKENTRIYQFLLPPKEKIDEKSDDLDDNESKDDNQSKDDNLGEDQISDINSNLSYRLRSRNSD